MLVLILLILAVVFLTIQSLGVATGRVQIGWLGLACWALAVLLGLHPL